MGADLQELNAPAVALGQISHGAALEEAGHLLGSILVVAVLDLGDLNRGIAGQSVFDGNGQVDDFHCKTHSFSQISGIIAASNVFSKYCAKIKWRLKKGRKALGDKGNHG